MAVSTSGAVRKKNGTFEGTGQGWIRTSEGVKPADLQSAPFGHSGTYPFASVDIGSRQMRRKCALRRITCMARFAVTAGNPFSLTPAFRPVRTQHYRDDSRFQLKRLVSISGDNHRPEGRC